MTLDNMSATLIETFGAEKALTISHAAVVLSNNPIGDGLDGVTWSAAFVYSVLGSVMGLRGAIAEGNPKPPREGLLGLAKMLREAADAFEEIANDA